MIRKDWTFCGQNLQTIAILHKKLKFFMFIFFGFNLFFPKNFHIVTFHLPVAFQKYRIYQMLLNIQVN